MILNSRLISLVLSLVISIITTLLLSFFNDISRIMVVVILLGSFTISYLAVFIALELLVFREINRIRNVLKSLGRRKGQGGEVEKGIIAPFKEINREIHSYASFKEEEIDNLKKMMEFRKEFIANVSHELKTPIFAAQGFVHTLLDGAVKDKSVRKKFLEKAARSLDALDVLVQDLLILSQIETGEIQMNYEYFDLKKLVEDIIEQFEDKAEKKEIELTCEVTGSDDEINVYADWQRVKQVFINLISNALNYTNSGGKVQVLIKRVDKEMEIRVKDTGIGIPEEDIARIFERFYRVDKSRSRTHGGTGLGLAIVKHILDGHRTSVNVESTVGKGTIFKFKLPMEEGLLY